MPAATSSIYWDSVDSQRSSGGSSGDGVSGNNRNYVDPWDLENYAYLRRRSVTASNQPTYQSQQTCQAYQAPSRAGRSRTSYTPQIEPDYGYATSVKEPGYHAPASVEEIYFGVQKQAAPNYYYSRSIYEEDVSHYAAPLSIYSPMPRMHRPEPFEVYASNAKLRKRSKLQKTRNHRREECIYHGTIDEAFEYQENPLPSRTSRHRDTRYLEVVPPTRLDLNTYGHLKIDYTNSWDSLHRKIGK